MGNEFTTAVDLEIVRYSQVCEDFSVLERGLEVSADDDILSIGSAGCNVLALLLREPRSITAVDASGAQIALVELKLAAIRRLDHPTFLILMGAGPELASHGAARAAIYQQLRDELPELARRFWDRSADSLQQGLLHCGRLERYFRGFQTEHLARIHPPEVVETLLEQDNATDRMAWFDQRFATEPLRRAFAEYFGQKVLQSHGRDPAQFRYVTTADTGQELFARLRAMCARPSVRGNFYLEYFLTCRYRDVDAGPPYLSRPVFDRLKTLIDRVVVTQDSLENVLQRAPSRRFSKANLSDIFEYISEDATAALLRNLATSMRPGGRIAFWNLFVPRPVPSGVGELRALREEAEQLHRDDRVFFYQAFHLAEVIR